MVVSQRYFSKLGIIQEEPGTLGVTTNMSLNMTEQDEYSRDIKN